MDAPKALFASQELSFAAKALGALMWSHARPNKPPFVWPSAATLAKELGTTERRVYDLLKELYAHGFAERRKDVEPHGWMLTVAGDMSPATGHGQQDMSPAAVETVAGSSKSLSPAAVEDSIESESEAITEASKNSHGQHVAGSMSPAAGHRRQSPFNAPGDNPIDRFERQGNTGHFCQTPEQLLRQYGRELFAGITCFDGLDSRPTKLEVLKGKWGPFERERWKTRKEAPAVDTLRLWLLDDARRARPPWERTASAPSTTSARPKLKFVDGREVFESCPALGEGEEWDPETKTVRQTR